MLRSRIRRLEISYYRLSKKEKLWSDKDDLFRPNWIKLVDSGKATIEINRPSI